MSQTVATPAEIDNLIATGRNWLRDSPTVAESRFTIAATLQGAHTPLPFVCANCITRLRGRGCYVEKLATVNVWKPAPAPAPCSLCA